MDKVEVDQDMNKIIGEKEVGIGVGKYYFQEMLIIEGMTEA